MVQNENEVRRLQTSRTSPTSRTSRTSRTSPTSRTSQTSPTSQTSRTSQTSQTSRTSQYTFKWTKQQTEEFIRLRTEHQHLFTGGKNTASSTYQIILDKLGIGGRITHTQAKKKWDNLRKKYKECKCPSSGQGSEEGKPTAATWPLFTLMDEALGQSGAVSHSCLITSSEENEPELSAAQTSQEEEDESQCSSNRTQGCVQIPDYCSAHMKNRLTDHQEMISESDKKSLRSDSLTAPLNLKKKKNEVTTSPTEQYTFKWTKQQTEEFIRLRTEHQHLFTGGKNTASSTYQIILDKLGIGGRITHTQAKKKWDNLRKKYKECKCPSSGQGSEEGKPTAATWPLFTLMDEALGQSGAVSHSCLITSSEENELELSAAQTSQEEEEEERKSDRTQGCVQIPDYCSAHMKNRLTDHQEMISESDKKSLRSDSLTAPSTTSPTEQYTFKWTKQQTEEFIRLRTEHQHLFTGGKNTASSTYQIILDKLGIGGRITHTQAKKKWDNLRKKYKECKCPSSGQGSEEGKPTAATWPLFTLMDEALGQSGAVSHSCLITSSEENEPELSAAQTSQEEEEERKSDRERGEMTWQRGERKRKREMEDPFLTLLKEDLQYQREADERREAEARERASRFFALLERLAEKLKK